MGFLLSFLLFFVILTISSGAAPRKSPPSRVNGPHYTTRYDYIDVDAILKSNRLLKNYMECVLERGPCTREGLELRKNIPDALETECAKCSQKQKENAGKIMAYLLQYKKDYWRELLAKYDPDGTFRKKYEVDDIGDGDDYDGEEENKENEN